MQDTPRRSARWLVALAALMLAALACNLARRRCNARPNAISHRHPARPDAQPALPPPRSSLSSPLRPAHRRRGDQPDPGRPYPGQLHAADHWPAYTVVAGDTLSRIAERVGSTCRPACHCQLPVQHGLIFVGQQGSCPALPATQAPVATRIPTNRPFRENLAVQPFWLDSASRAVTYSETVRVNAGKSSMPVDVVDFYVNDPAGGPAVFMGQDVDPWMARSSTTASRRLAVTSSRPWRATTAPSA